MTKFHIGKDGTPKECPAKIKCRLASESEHFSSFEEAKNFSDKINERDSLIAQYKGKKLLKLKLAISKINTDLGRDRNDGIYSKQELAEMEKAAQERKQKAEEQEKKALENYKKFLSLDTLELPESLKLNDVRPKGFYNKTKIYEKAVRGELDTSTKTHNTGTAMWGLGKYTTTNKKYAKKFGTVRPAEWDELPSIPLVLKDELSAKRFEQELTKKYNIRLKDLYKDHDLSYFIKKMGYDGLAFGPKNDMIIVNYENKNR